MINLSPLILVGALLALISSFCFNFAAIFQKKGLMSLPEIDFDAGIRGVFVTLGEYFKNKYWLIGALLAIFGCIPYLFAVEMIGILAVQPLMMTGLIAFVISGRFLLNEKINLMEYIAIGFLIFSPFLIVLSGIYNVPLKISDIFVPFLLFLMVIIIGILSFFFITRKMKDNTLEIIFYGIIAGILGALSAILANIFIVAFKEANIQLNLLGLMEIFFGIFWFDLAHFLLFISFWGIFIFNSISFFFLQNAFKKGRVTIIQPIFNCVILIVPVIAGVYIFNQGCQNIYLFLISVILTIFAIIILGKFQSRIQIDEFNEIT